MVEATIPTLIAPFFSILQKSKALTGMIVRTVFPFYTMLTFSKSIESADSFLVLYCSFLFDPAYRLLSLKRVSQGRIPSRTSLIKLGLLVLNNTLQRPTVALGVLRGRRGGRFYSKNGASSRCLLKSLAKPPVPMIFNTSSSCSL